MSKEFKNYLRQDIIQQNIKVCLISIRGLDKGQMVDKDDKLVVSLTDSLLEFYTHDLKEDEEINVDENEA